MKITRTGLSLLTLGLLTMGASGAQAQKIGRGARPAHRAQQSQANSLLMQLDLTPAQKQQIVGIETTEKGQVKAIKENTALAPADKVSQEKTARKASRAQILAVLTPAQRAQLKQLAAQRRQQKGQTATGTATGTTPGTSTGTPAGTSTGTAPAAGTPTPPSGAPASAPGKGAASADDGLGDLDDLA